jgi:hypothetical protein
MSFQSSDARIEERCVTGETKIINESDEMVRVTHILRVSLGTFKITTAGTSISAKPTKYQCPEDKRNMNYSQSIAQINIVIITYHSSSVPVQFWAKKRDVPPLNATLYAPLGPPAIPATNGA